MSDPPKRRWFQLHLSTCVVLMCVAGALLGLNVLVYVALEEVAKTWFRPTEVSMRFEDLRNPATFLLVLFSVWVLIRTTVAFERYVRRRERKRAAQEPAP